MLKRDERSTNFGRSELGIVQRDDHGKGTNTETSDEATGKDVVIGSAVSGCLDDNTDAEKDAGEDNTHFTPKGVSEDAIGESRCRSTTVGSWTPARWHATVSAKRSDISTRVTHVTAVGSVSGSAALVRREGSVSSRTWQFS